MRPNPTRDTYVGAAVAVALAGLFAFSYGGKKMLASEASVGTYPVTAVFNRVDGLFEGDQVYLSGIPIGVVGKQYLDENFRAVVRLNLNSGVMLPTDSAAAIHTDGLFGAKFVVVEPGIEETALAANGVIQYTQDAVVVSELLDLIIAEGKARRAQDSNAQAEDTPAAPENQQPDSQQEGN